MALNLIFHTISLYRTVCHLIPFVTYTLVNGTQKSVKDAKKYVEDGTWNLIYRLPTVFIEDVIPSPKITFPVP